MKDVFGKGTILSFILLPLIAVLFFLGFKSPSAQSTVPDIIVNTTADVADFGGAQQVGDLPGPDGFVSLREAITAANNTLGPQVIAFNIPLSDAGYTGGVFVIKPLPLGFPGLYDSGTTIDGTTQTAFSGDTNPFGPEIVLDGSVAGNCEGINFGHSSNSTIRGLVIHSFEGAGIQIGGGYIGNDKNKIVGCYIGTDETGTLDRGNGLCGIQVEGNGNIIGGTNPADRNIISGNERLGVGIGEGSIENRVVGNFIGTDRTGTSSLGNTGFGIHLAGSNNVIGGTVERACNVVSGSTNNGIVIIGNGNRIEGNFIGTDVTGKNPLPNDGLGVSIVYNSTGNVIKRNLIAFNMSDGIAVAFNSTRNTVSQNSIFSNFDLGIDLGNGGPDDYHGDGVTYNDPGDADAGPNNLMNFPVLSSAIVLGSRLVVKGTIDTPNPSTVTIEFFANLVPSPGGDPSGYGEGAVFLGKIRPNKQGRFSTVLPKVPLGTLITATATDAQGNTSEFAANITASH
jgi:hypothetical protein